MNLCDLALAALAAIVWGGSIAAAVKLGAEWREREAFQARMPMRPRGLRRSQVAS